MTNQQAADENLAALLELCNLAELTDELNRTRRVLLDAMADGDAARLRVQELTTNNAEIMRARVYWKDEADKARVRLEDANRRVQEAERALAAAREVVKEAGRYAPDGVPVSRAARSLYDALAVLGGDVPETESRWCHKSGEHSAHRWSESGRDFECSGVGGDVQEQETNVQEVPRPAGGMSIPEFNLGDDPKGRHSGGDS